MNKQEILNKARQRTAARNYIYECLEGDTCPECGGGLESKEVLFCNHRPCRPHKNYKCNSCDFEYEHSV